MSIPSCRKFWGGPGNSPSPGPHRLPPLRSLGAGWGRRGGTLLPSPLPPPATPSAAAPDPPQPSPTLGLREHPPAGRAEPGPLAHRRSPARSAPAAAPQETLTPAHGYRAALFLGNKARPRPELQRCHTVPSVSFRAVFSAQLRLGRRRSAAPGRGGTGRGWRGGARCSRGGRWGGHGRAPHSRHRRITLQGRGAAGPTFLPADPLRSDGVHSQSQRPHGAARQSERSWWAEHRETWMP